MENQMTDGVAVDEEGPVVTLTLDRPEVLNAITPAMLMELGDALRSVAARPDVRAVVLTGRDRAFSAGVDLKALGEASLEGGSVGSVLDEPARAAIALLTTMPQIVVAKVNGPCFTGALELALACDLIVVAAEAKLGDTHAKWGLRPTWGMSQRLCRMVGVARARELSYTARTFTGLDAEAWGLAVRAAPASELDDVVSDLVGALLENSQGSLTAYKDLYRVAFERDLLDGLRHEATTSYEIEDTEERLAAFR
jgi:enoyl-CoA hydratase/carnithine racemase